MTTHSKYFDSIRLSSRKKQKKKADNPPCQWNKCSKEGNYKAPAGRNREGEFFFFCLDHVREYNKNFNYFSDLTQDEINKLQKKSIRCQNSTSFSMKNAHLEKKSAAPEFAKIRSGSAAYHKRLRHAYRSPQNENFISPVPKFKTLETKAFLILGLPVGASSENIKTQYKALLKAHHPDLNNGDRSSEKRFQEVLNAYNILKNSGLC